jgi:hypothetical protein
MLILTLQLGLTSEVKLRGSQRVRPKATEIELWFWSTMQAMSESVVYERGCHIVFFGHQAN